MAAAECYTVGLADDVDAWWKARLGGRASVAYADMSGPHPHTHAVAPHLIIQFRLIYLDIIISIII